MTPKQELLLKQKHTIALLEFPLLQIRISEGLGKKSIPFHLGTGLDGNFLLVQVVNEYFLQIPVSVETVDRIVGLIPYCLHRPDLAHEEIPGIICYKDCFLARRWPQVANGGKK